ncbi:MAG: 4Fe-4S binding protein, partial [Chloroflexi bacterium]|nr:4Fe-4S binding protein [Chloroflexota bacterium]
MKNRISRRDFIKMGGGVIGGVLLYTLPSVAREVFRKGTVAQSSPLGTLDPSRLEKHYWGFIVDNEKCIGCGKCVVACKNENRV